ncbi:MAG TPA: hypothetical protein PLJ42_12275 [Chitinophagales bacterium]|nr:hypothetical protein [Chitinophagales bacterium]HQW80201.1 hypothetical protein [Chitinophagales bacterium]
MKNELIKKYLANEMLPAERHQFELEMEQDPFLMESVEGLSMLQEQYNMEELHQLETELSTPFTANIPIAKKSKWKDMSFFKYAAAACVIGIFTFVSWRLIIIQKSRNNDAIFTQYYTTLTHPDAIVRSDQQATLEQKAIQAYEHENYFEAVNEYQKLVANNPNNVKNNLFLGLSYLSTNQAPKAIDIFNKIIEANEYGNEIKWYLALAYIKNNQIQEAQNLFHQLASTENFYQQKSKEILESLDGKIALKN